MRSSHQEQFDFVYQRVAESLRARVLNGVYQPGERLPRQHDLAREYNVGINTLKKALDILQSGEDTWSVK